MMKFAPLLPILLIATACARTEAVSEDELETIETEAPVLAAPEEVDDGAAALPTSAMGWRIDGDRVVLGASAAEPSFEIACGEDENGIILTRYGVEGSGSAGTLTIVGNGASARVPVVAADAGTEDEFNWTATLARGELASNIRTAFSVDEPVNITATGVEPIIVAGESGVRTLLDRCVGTDSASDSAAAASEREVAPSVPADE